jgi:hypothetical protein
LKDNPLVLSKEIHNEKKRKKKEKGQTRVPDKWIKNYI